MSSDTGTPHAGPRAGMREWIGLAVLALPTVLLALDFTVLHLALPHLTAELGPSSSQQLWILDIYGFMIAGFLITMGTLGDRIGRRRLLMIGAACFGAASVLAAYAVSAEMLIATRALLGIAGATLMPSTLSLISTMFHDPKQRGFAVAVWLSCFSAGGAIGPLIGGALLEWFWWGAVFLMGVPVMVLLLITAPLLLPEYRTPDPGRIDLISVALSLAAILPIVYAVKDAAGNGWSAPAVGIVLVGFVFGGVFVRRQRSLEDPLMDVGLFRFRAFTVGLGSLLLGTLALGAFVLLFAQYLQIVQELPPIRAGLWMAPYAVANIAGAMIAPAVAAKLPANRTIALGLLVAAIGFAMFTRIGGDGGLVLGIVASTLITFGLSPLMVLVIDLVIAAAPKERSGSASAMSETCSELGMALGVATLGAVGTAVYRAVIELPAGVAGAAAEQARDGLPGAAAAAADLPPNPAGDLLASAQNAFMTGLSAVGWASAVMCVAIAGLTWLFLKPGGEQNEDSGSNGEGDAGDSLGASDAGAHSGEGIPTEGR
ncbi:MFS transporter [Streptomonospora salina]|uniref:DHA2 family multidrug resistance protein-like MFS transporter n=1 Tax=Streptomonospora salina TaxID=104205 RepID=A0A841E5N2_9ACTN|nr:MFS transporter [Streptomonospora salina]MBB5996498.1 DHA2 family multidrug resistance protein-like MFS transporter [Streptomonospora salina]